MFRFEDTGGQGECGASIYTDSKMSDLIPKGVDERSQLRRQLGRVQGKYVRRKMLVEMANEKMIVRLGRFGERMKAKVDWMVRSEVRKLVEQSERSKVNRAEFVRKRLERKRKRLELEEMGVVEGAVEV